MVPWQTFSVECSQQTFCIVELRREKNIYVVTTWKFINYGGISKSMVNRNRIHHSKSVSWMDFLVSAN